MVASTGHSSLGIWSLKYVYYFIRLSIGIPIGIVSKLYTFVVMNSLLGYKRSEEEHSRRVGQIQEHVRKWKEQGSKKMMCTATPAWKSISASKTNKSGWFQVPVSLDKVIKIDEEKKELTVEPGLMMGQLTRILVPMGWTIPVVPELSNLTVGGLIAGAGLETSSHKYGLFCDTALSYEIVLPDSSVVTCSKDTNPDIFYSIPGSYGTLGFITAVTFPLVSATPHVTITYHYCKGSNAMKNLILAEGVKHEFIEAFAYNEEDFVVMFGDFTSGKVADESVNNINKLYKPLFHRQAEAVMNKLKGKRGSTMQEFIPTVEYYHRHCRGAFWVVEALNPLWQFRPTIWFLGWILPVNVRVQIFAPFIIKLIKEQMVIQDYVVPIDEFEQFFAKGCKDFKIFPVWICPTKILQTSTMFSKAENSALYIDLGFYGNPPVDCSKPNLLRKFENLCIEAKGFAGLYADSYLTKEQFHKMFDLSLYNKVRESTGADKAFPFVYDKISPNARRLKSG